MPSKKGMSRLPTVSDHLQVARHLGLSILRVNSKETPRPIRAKRTITMTRYRVENIVAYHDGKAAKIAAAATTSHTSLPSQTGPMELTTMRRSTSFLATKECSIPTPKSNPSKMKNPTKKMAMMMNQMVLRWTMSPPSR